GQFSDKQVGQGKTVTLSNSISGIDAQNYSIQLNDTATADITVKTISGMVTAENKVYDGKTNATVSGSLLDVIAGDDVQLSSTGQFSDKQVGQGKTVTLSNSISGIDAQNYSIQLNDTATADITVKTISGMVTADNKVYDGKTNATVSGSLLDVIAGDDVQLSSTGQFATKDVGSNKTVTLTNQFSGADLNNYSIQLNDTATADITVKTISGTVTAENKVYDGKTNATVSGSLLDVIAGDDVQLSSTGQFATKDVGSNKTVTLTNQLSGADLNNYSIQLNDTATADITVKTISGMVTAENKVYDGKTNATVSGSLLDVIAGDDVQLSSTGQFTSKNVGVGKSVNLIHTISGADAGNYDITINRTTRANIIAKEISVQLQAQDKIYDGSTSALITGNLTDIIADDNVTLSTRGIFDDRNVGQDKTVTITRARLTGADATNYRLVNNTTTTASISPLELRATITAENKIYDGTQSVILSASLDGVFNGDEGQPADTVYLLTQGAFADKNAGQNKIVNVSGVLAGQDAHNYIFRVDAPTTANITPATLVVAVNNSQKQQGQANPRFSSSLNNFVVTDNLTGLSGNIIFAADENTNLATLIADVSGRLIFSTNANADSTAGDYTVSLSGLSSTNYQFAYQTGILTVIPVTGTAEQPSIDSIPLRNNMPNKPEQTHPLVAQNTDIQDMMLNPLGLVVIEGDGMQLPNTVMSANNIDDDVK
ncbi:YDG domain-containing protein, partial [Agitococcus lubricus]